MAQTNLELRDWALKYFPLITEAIEEADSLIPVKKNQELFEILKAIYSKNSPSHNWLEIEFVLICFGRHCIIGWDIPDIIANLCDQPYHYNHGILGGLIREIGIKIGKIERSLHCLFFLSFYNDSLLFLFQINSTCKAVTIIALSLPNFRTSSNETEKVENEE